MEEKKQNEVPQDAAQKPAAKLSYDELKKRAGDLFIANQKMEQYIKKAEGHIEQLEKALEDQSFNQMSFFLSMLFKVVEHPEMYKDEFVQWCVERIETALVSFGTPTEEHPVEEEKGSEA